MKRNFLILFMMMFSFAVQAQEAKVFQTQEGAIKGFDPVAYFKERKPVKGQKYLVYKWNGANWHFANQKNLAAFKASPAQYAPQYGGYCAYGYSKGYAAPTQPDAWTVKNNKLYLNYDQNVRTMWNKNQDELIKKADENWKKDQEKK